MIKFTADSRGKLAKLISGRGVPYSAVRKLLRGREIKVNGERVNTDLTCEKGDLIEVYFVPAAKETPLDPVYKDEKILILNKPAGVSSEEYFETVKRAYPSAAAVHRLDRNTCGLIVYALTEGAEAELLHGFKNRAFKKLYYAEVFGFPEPPAAVLTAYLKKDVNTATVRISDKAERGYREIRTGYRTIKRGESTTLLEVELLTGRTHQIRAHLSHIGHPIIGDEKYGDPVLNKAFGTRRQRLQAFSIELRFSPDSELSYLNDKVFTVEKERFFE